ncbi:MAG: cell division protein SepF [Coriobacteriales bacterium]|jgi:cell division inhibitor SepF|nr:cell division protein SepF [Coriobacteriales bacterium]
MGIFDNVKSRLGLGSDQGDYYDGDEYGQHGGYAPGAGQYADDGYDTTGAGDDDDYNRRGFDSQYRQQSLDSRVSRRGFGVDRSTYQNDEHAPLVSISDVRASTPLNLDVAQPRADRIPTPRAYRRATNSFAPNGLDEDALAFKDGLARSETNSLSELQSERLRLEDTGRISVRRGRRIENVRPVTYADAEQVAKLLRGNYIVVLDLQATRPELAKRILDFSFGVASALEGQVDRFADRIYVFTKGGPLTTVERSNIQGG